ncbi:isocitrate lyase/phosphoenolpyruvate mutase family protein [Nonomuraea roseoviolacea]|uniref:2-methylisocitrate lyase-like PEP mutase family enzyme n=1 Tax=Nonomuraea roseoviolacea subsp. carminata TaxID=160689 RepID=A0ABT1JYP8_9ACTN|nr:isocitrate lyase/phosphoenolpyruvate mutase family protein [Nonomuraea roseoviolacea]MCP2346750.1 2-methylisocitrate lyase-like PEP mutase family enzyme [Nonomuraea roseoviolacea subsp. carminata]
MSVDSFTSADAATQRKARLFRSLSAEPVLVLPNAWDAASAAVIAAAGATAIATTSGGVAWSLGSGDGQRLGRDEMVEAARRVVDCVDVPVTVDVEGGYGPAPADVAATVRAVVGAGAVGVNLEDSTAVGGPLFDVAEQAARLRAARDAATEAGLPELFVNARTDVYLFGIGAPDGRLGEVLERAAAYAEAGADGIFVPGLLDLDALNALCAASPLPVNAMAVAGGPTVAELAQAGVRRVSLGTALAQAAYTAARRAAAELLGTGGLTALDGSLGFGELDALFRR